MKQRNNKSPKHIIAVSNAFFFKTINYIIFQIVLVKCFACLETLHQFNKIIL